MRVLFSGVSAHGHLLPLVPLTVAAVQAGHQVALLAGKDAAPLVESEFPAGVEHLVAGPTVPEFVEEMGRRTGVDPLRPPPWAIGEAFGGIRLDLGLAAALERATDWRPDLIIAESWDAVGPAVAAAHDVALIVVGVGPMQPAEIRDPFTAAAAARHSAAELPPALVDALVVSWPAELESAQVEAGIRVLPIRGLAHRRPGTSPAPVADGTGERPRVLVTFGTIFSDPDTVAAAVAEVAAGEVDVEVARGFLIDAQQLADANGDGIDGGQRPTGAVRYHSFVPLDELLGGCDVVVAAGGSGTVLAALAHGVPLVLWPQGADQPINAAAAAQAGVGTVVSTVEEIGPAVSRVLKDDRYRARARAVSAAIAARPGPPEVLDQIMAIATARATA